MTWEIYIPLIALGLSLVSLVVQSIKHDSEKLKEIEFSIIRKQREVKKFQKENDTTAMMAAQKEMMGLSMEKMKVSMRGSLWTMPLFLIIWWFVLGPALTVGPLYAGEASELGVGIRNLDTMSQTLTVELISSELDVTGQKAYELILDDKGDNGDYQELWWTVTASEGSKEYAVKITAREKSDEENYAVSFVSPDALTADFSPNSGARLFLDESLEMEAKYHTTRVNLFGNVLDWSIYYIVSFFIMAILLTPLRNHLFWGHHKGVKHLEKLDQAKK